MNKVRYIKQQIIAGMNNDTLLTKLHIYASTVYSISITNT